MLLRDGVTASHEAGAPVIHLALLDDGGSRGDVGALLDDGGSRGDVGALLQGMIGRNAFGGDTLERVAPTCLFLLLSSHC